MVTEGVLGDTKAQANIFKSTKQAEHRQKKNLVLKVGTQNAAAVKSGLSQSTRVPIINKPIRVYK